MKVVQTTVTEAEHRLLEEFAKENSKTMKEVLRMAIRRILEADVNRNDPIFTEPPAAKKTGKRDDGSEEHDRHLYRERA